MMYIFIKNLTFFKKVLNLIINILFKSYFKILILWNMRGLLCLHQLNQKYKILVNF